MTSLRRQSAKCGLVWIADRTRMMVENYTAHSTLRSCLYESPRWLLAVGQNDRAERALKGILRFNGRPMPEMEKTMRLLAEKAAKGPANASIKDIWPFRNLRRNLFIMFTFWYILPSRIPSVYI